MQLTKIFEPITINKTEFKNRLVVSAMVTNYCKEDGNLSDQFVAYHEEKAKGGWGVIITEDYAIAPHVGGFKALPGLWDDEMIEWHKPLPDRVHKAGGKIIAQIYHAGRETSSEITGETPVGPSAMREPTMPEIPKALTVEEIQELVQKFGDCARRVKAAGFDGVEIHGAHGYLIGAFLSPFSNKRNDAYGGSLSGRARFPLEVVRKVREAVGPDFPIFYRISSIEYVHGGLSLEDSTAFACMLEDAGVNCIHCSHGVYVSTHTISSPSIVPNGFYADNAAALKAVVNIPVIAVGRITDPFIAESILRAGKSDMVTMARASLADPALPNKAKAGEIDDIIRCIGCTQGCSGELGQGKPIRCLVNPRTGQEYIQKLVPAEKKKKILVAGGGVAGCMAAIVAAQRGHEVVVYEKSSALGGQWETAAIPIGKTEFNTFTIWQQHQLSKLGVKVVVNTEATKASVAQENPDTVVIATGSYPCIPPIKGIDSKMTCTAHDALRGNVNLGEKVVVIGGGLIGAETADHLAQHGHCVSIIEMLPEIAAEGEANPMKYLFERLDEANVAIFTSATVTEIAERSIKFIKDEQECEIDNVDTVVVAVGVRSETGLAEALADTSYDVISVGDANIVRNGYHAIQSGFEAGLRL